MEPSKRPLQARTMQQGSDDRRVGGRNDNIGLTGLRSKSGMLGRPSSASDSALDRRTWESETGEGESETDSLLPTKDDAESGWGRDSDFEEIAIQIPDNFPKALPAVRMKRPNSRGSSAAAEAAPSEAMVGRTKSMEDRSFGPPPSPSLSPSPTTPSSRAAVFERYRKKVSVVTKPPFQDDGGNVKDRVERVRKSDGETVAGPPGATGRRQAEASLISSLGIQTGHHFVTSIGAVEIDNMEKIAMKEVAQERRDAALRKKEGGGRGQAKEQSWVDSLHLRPVSYETPGFGRGGGSESSSGSEEGSDWDDDSKEKGDPSGTDFSVYLTERNEMSRGGAAARSEPMLSTSGSLRSQLALESGYSPAVPGGNGEQGKGEDEDEFEAELDNRFGKQSKKAKTAKKEGDILAHSKTGKCCTLLLIVMVLVVLWWYIRAYLHPPSAKKGAWESHELRGNRSAFEDAMKKTFLFLEAQRSGKLPPSNRVPWRSDSGMTDGMDRMKNLTGGYYDSGDNIKFNLPLSFTLTMLSWGVIEYRELFGRELDTARVAIKWGTDYLLKCWDSEHELLVVQVGNAAADHECWLRPEDTTIPRTTMVVNSTHPGSDVAGEMAAALAAASVALGREDEEYYNLLQSTAAELCRFAMSYPGYYSKSVPDIVPFYNSTEYEDEILWCNAWLYRATAETNYLDYVVSKVSLTKTHQSFEFNWDSKHAGLHVLLSTLPGTLRPNDMASLDPYDAWSDQFACYQVSADSQCTPSGLSYVRKGDQLEYVAASCFIILVYSDFLKRNGKDFALCKREPEHMMRWAQYQAEYVLGNNPNNMSYMVGYGSKYPLHAHHRGASIAVRGTANVSNSTYTCEGGKSWLHTVRPNPYVVTGAIVGGPSITDTYDDVRENYMQSEPSTYVAGVFAAIFARLANPNLE